MPSDTASELASRVASDPVLRYGGLSRAQLGALHNRGGKEAMENPRENDHKLPE